jgi:DNA invertase Pin-like site-specific DNA recombinase
MNVYGYMRVSTTEQASNGESLDTQKNQISGWAMMKAGRSPRSSSRRV